MAQSTIEGPKMNYIIMVFTTTDSIAYIYDRRLCDENAYQQINLKWWMLSDDFDVSNSC